MNVELNYILLNGIECRNKPTRCIAHYSLQLKINFATILLTADCSCKWICFNVGLNCIVLWCFGTAQQCFGNAQTSGRGLSDMLQQSFDRAPAETRVASSSGWCKAVVVVINRWFHFNWVHFGWFCIISLLYLSCICGVFVVYLWCICVVFVLYLCCICIVFAVQYSSQPINQ